MLSMGRAATLWQGLKLTGGFLAVPISPGKRGRYRTDCIL